MGRERGRNDRPQIAAGHHAFLVAVVVLCRVLLVPACPTYDDAFITYRYAQHAADGLGLVYNPGAPWEPVLGTTTPLYAWLLVLPGKLGIDLVRASLVVNLLCDAAIAGLLPRLFGRVRSTSVWALLAFATFPPLVRISVGGMEAPLFGLCGLLAVLAAHADRPVRAGVWSALTCLVRPEGVLLCLVLGARAILRRRGEFLRYAAPIAGIGAIAVAILFAQYGSPIPQSVVAKSTMKPVDATGLAWSRIRTIWEQSFLPHAALLPCLPFVAHGLFRALRAAGPTRSFSLWALVITLAYTLAHPHTWGWYFFVPLLLWTVWLALSVDRIARWITARFGPALVTAGLTFGIPLGGALAILAAAIAGQRLESPVPKAVYEPLAAWARETSSREPEARVLASDIGLLGWHWRGTVLDSEGLTWPEALRHGSFNAILEAERPEYVVFLLERNRVRMLLERPDLLAAYEPLARYAAQGETALALSTDGLSEEWRPDYIVYRRRGP